MWPFKKKQQPEEPKAEEVKERDYTKYASILLKRKIEQGLFNTLKDPITSGSTCDSIMSLKNKAFDYSISDAQFEWFLSQGFLGYQVCSILAQHWLIDKACLMPGRDAVRVGYEINCPNEQAIELLKKYDKHFGIKASMREFIHMGRVFGVRVALFKVDSTDQQYYEKPFNPDGVTAGSYKGIAQIDPYWITPELTQGFLSDPANLHFYEPNYYLIGNKRYHRSHLAIFIPYPVADNLKPRYNYGGMSLPQLIHDRVYAAERTADEAPILAMTKRLTNLKISDDALSDINKVIEQTEFWTEFRDNFGVKISGEGEDIQQFDTSLADLDSVIMTQYQLVASIANVPATKLLGTVPKGFNSTGDYELETYREHLEGIQENDLTPFLERHHELIMRSYIAPQLGIAPLEATIDWNPLDSPTATEWATINKTKADTANVYWNTGAIDAEDIRKSVATDKNSDYYGLEVNEPADQINTEEGELGGDQEETASVQRF